MLHVISCELQENMEMLQTLFAALHALLALSVDCRTCVCICESNICVILVWLNYCRPHRHVGLHIPNTAHM